MADPEQKPRSKFVQNGSHTGGAASVRGDDVLFLHGDVIPDPYHALEDLDAPATLAWVKMQQEKLAGFLHADEAAQEKIAAEIAAPAQGQTRGMPVPIQGGYIFLEKGAQDLQPKLMIAETPEGEGRILIDPCKNDPTGETSLGSVHVSPDGKNLGYRLSKGGAWACPLAVMDLTTGDDLPSQRQGTGSMWWDQDGKGFTYSQLSDDGKFRVVLKHHDLGHPETPDSPVYDNPTSGSGGTLSNSIIRDLYSYTGKREFMFDATAGGDIKMGVSVKDPETKEFWRIFESGKAHYIPVMDSEDGVLMYTTHGAPNGKLVLFNPDDPAPENWKTVIPEDKADALRHVFFQHGKLFALYEHDCADKVRMFGTDGALLGEVPIPPQSRVNFSHAANVGLAAGAGVDQSNNNDLFIGVASFLEAPKPYRYDIETGDFSPLQKDAEPQGLSGCIVEQIWATSKDGTKIPMTIVRSPDTALDGSAAVMLEGYGAHGVSSTPHFITEMSDFVKAGGIYAQANVRGGGEFGQNWHEEGKGLNKQNSFDDFNACARHLVDQSYTAAGRIVSTGRSSGGLLVLGSMIQQPELYGAVIAEVPVTDMLRAGKINAQEYGDPEKSQENFENLKSYCPIQNIEAGKKYPNCFVRTAAGDRPLLADSYKFIATLQEKSPQTTALMEVEQDYNHGSSRPRQVEIANAAAKRAFIEKSIGAIDQDVYKQSIPAPMAPTAEVKPTQIRTPSSDHRKAPICN